MKSIFKFGNETSINLVMSCLYELASAEFVDKKELNLISL